MDYPASVSHFRAFMENLINSFPDATWFYQGEPALIFEYSHRLRNNTREGWSVYSAMKERPECRATILAYEFVADMTDVQIYDGVQFVIPISNEDESSVTKLTYEPFGECLAAFWDELFARISKRLSPRFSAPKEPQNDSVYDWFDYYYKIGSGPRGKMDYIAEKCHKSINTIYKEHTLYKNERGIEKRKSSKKK